MKAFFVLAIYGAVAMQTTASAQPANSPAAHSSNDYGLAYTSPFASYQRFQDAPPGAWQDTNQTVNRIGGWRAYARQAQETQTPAPAPAKETPSTGTATPPPKPQHDMANPHMHHGVKK
jgi:hypothetical protein